MTTIMNKHNRKIKLIGSAIGWGSYHKASALGPICLHILEIVEFLQAKGVSVEWQDIIVAPDFIEKNIDDSMVPLDIISDHIEKLYNSVSEILEDGGFPVSLGGDHSAVVGYYGALLNKLDKEEDLGLIWVDAHADLNTSETTISGHIHGMPLAAILGHGDDKYKKTMQGRYLKPENICLLGVRDLDIAEANFIREHGIYHITMDDIEEKGFEACLKIAKDYVLKNANKFAVTLDMDAFDPSEVAAVATPVPNGIKVKDFTNGFKKIIAPAPELFGLEISEFAPHNKAEETMGFETIAHLLEILSKKG